MKHISFVVAENPERVNARKKQIVDILGRGNIAVFTNGTLVKKVNEWNTNTDGDLVAFAHNGKVPFVCWETSAYTISEEQTN